MDFVTRLHVRFVLGNKVKHGNNPGLSYGPDYQTTQSLERDERDQESVCVCVRRERKERLMCIPFFTHTHT